MGRKGPINCQSHFTIPADTQPGIYALYWVWDFTKLTAIDPTYLELYTSCMDVEVVAGNQKSTSPTTKSKGHKSQAKHCTSKAHGHSQPKVTRTLHDTKTVTTHVTTTPTGSVNQGGSKQVKSGDIVYSTVHIEKFITVTRTI